MINYCVSLFAFASLFLVYSYNDDDDVLWNQLFCLFFLSDEVADKTAASPNPNPTPRTNLHPNWNTNCLFFLQEVSHKYKYKYKLLQIRFFSQKAWKYKYKSCFSSCCNRHFLAILSHFAGKGIRRFAETKLQQIPRTSHSEKWQTRSNLGLGCGRFSYLRWKTGFHQWRYEVVSMADGDGDSDHLAWWLDWSCYYWWWWRWWWYTGLIIILMMVMVKMMK